MRRRGFTLIEMIIVAAIIAVLLLIAVPVSQGLIASSQATACEADRKELYDDFTARYLLAQADNASGDPIATAARALAEDFSGKSGTVRGASLVITGACPAAGTYTVTYDNGYLISSSAHGGSSAAPSADGSVTLTDSAAGTHVLSPTASWETIRQLITKGWNLKEGYVLSDGKKTYLVASWSEPWLKEDASALTLGQLVARYPDSFTELTDSGKIYTAADLKDNYGSYSWTSNPQKGDVCYYQGSYYVAPGPIGSWTLPPGGWIKVVQ